MELIKCDSYESLADYIFVGPNKDVPNESCVVYCHLDDIAEFFNKCEGKPYRYIVISGRSDYAICNQEDYPVANDIRKWIHFQEAINNKGYEPLIMHPRCRAEYCKITDRYSIRIYSFTKDTFDRIPNNVASWFCVNANVVDDRIIPIPFGIPDWTASLIDTMRLPVDKKPEDRIYVNFSLNTLERADIKRMARAVDWCHDSDEVSHEEYVRQVANHKVIMSPNGNGFDCYRNLESIYLGSVPLIVDGLWTRAYDGLPILRGGSDILSMRKGDYEYIIKTIDDNPHVFTAPLEGTSADLSFWRNEVEKKKNSL